MIGGAKVAVSTTTGNLSVDEVYTPTEQPPLAQYTPTERPPPPTVHTHGAQWHPSCILKISVNSLPRKKYLSKTKQNRQISLEKEEQS